MAEISLRRPGFHFMKKPGGKPRSRILREAIAFCIAACGVQALDLHSF
jgi:hypothetical protein